MGRPSRLDSVYPAIACIDVARWGACERVWPDVSQVPVCGHAQRRRVTARDALALNSVLGPLAVVVWTLACSTPPSSTPAPTRPITKARAEGDGSAGGGGLKRGAAIPRAPKATLSVPKAQARARGGRRHSVGRGVAPRFAQAGGRRRTEKESDEEDPPPGSDDQYVMDRSGLWRAYPSLRTLCVCLHRSPSEKAAYSSSPNAHTTPTTHA